MICHEGSWPGKYTLIEREEWKNWIIIKLIIKKCAVRMWTRLKWLSIGSCGKLL
jgi:hypothetical protein